MPVNNLFSRILTGFQLLRTCREQVLLRKHGRLEVALCASLVLHLLVLALALLTSGGNMAGVRQMDSHVLNAMLSPVSRPNPAVPAPEEQQGEYVSPESDLHQKPDVDIRLNAPDPITQTALAAIAPQKTDAAPPSQSAAASDVHMPSGVSGPGKQPRLLSEIVLDYPSSAGDREGRVTLGIVVNATGSVDEVLVISSDPTGVFDDAAIRAFSPARFSPGEMLGVPVRSSIVVEVSFFPTSRGNVSGRAY